MQFVSLSIQGFRSFQEKSEFIFPEKPGLYLLSGQNKVEPALGANGAGKSTIWDAMFWCLYNKTLRGLKGDNVVNWSSDHVEVTLVFIDNQDRRIEVIRTRNPNNFTVNGEHLTQEDFLDEFKVDSDAFSSIVVMSQFGRYFFDRTPTEQLAIFSALLHLSYWEDKGKLASDACKDLEVRLNKLEKEEAKIVGGLDELSGTLSEAKRDRQQFEENRDTEIKQVRDEIEMVDIEVSGVRQALENAEEQLQTAEEVCERAEERVEIVDDIVSRAHGDQMLVRGKLEHAEVELDEVQALEDVCPLCDQKIEEEHREELLGYVQDHHEELQGEYVEVDNSYKTNREQQEFERKKAKDAKAALKLAGKVAKAAHKEQHKVLGRSRALQEDLARLESQENPFEDTVLSVKKRVQMSQKRLAEVQQRIKAARDHFESYSFWAKGFKDLRLWIIDCAAAELEINVNNTLMDLGLRDWSVNFDVERAAKKKGKTIKGFHVMVESPESGEGTPWVSWSGGETQRLRVAGAVGLADLATSRTGFTPSIEVWDEPTAHLSAEGIEDLLDYLKNRAYATGKQIWLVDHRSLDAGNFAGEVTVVKDEDGSHLSK